MRALLTRLVNMKTDLNIWFDRLSNWQFVAVLASIFILCCAAGAGVSDLAGSHVNLRYTIPGDVLFTVAFTAVAAWKRWK